MDIGKRLFPINLSSKKWVEFIADGYSKPAIGSIHSKEYSAVSGMPLGGIDTGCIDIETSGLFGYYTIFNSHVPRGGPMNYPFLGMSVDDKTWVFTTKNTKKYFDSAFLKVGSAVNEWSKHDYIPPNMELDGTEEIKDIHYWGHYPIVDMEYEMDSPISVGVRAWAPFIPGDSKISMLPGSVFEVILRNTSGCKKRGTITFSFSGPEKFEVGANEVNREKVSGKVNGTHVQGKYSSYFLGVIGNENLRIGGSLDNNGKAWCEMSNKLPEQSNNRFGTSAAIDFDLKKDEVKKIKFILSWYSAKWLGRGSFNPKVTYKGIEKKIEETHGKKDRIPASSNFYKHMYATIYKSALDAALKLEEKHEELLNRIISWQQEIYQAYEIPYWLRGSLINILHLITEDSTWAAAEYPIGEWCKKEDGLFGMNECPRGCPQIECLPCSFYGNIPIVYFFPDAAISTLRGYKAYQFSDGAAPWIFGGITDNTAPIEMVYPTPGYQTTLNGPCYVSMVYRMWRRTGDENLLKEFYPSVKKNTRFTVNLRPEYEIGDAIISMPSGNFGSVWLETDNPGWYGMVTWVGGMHLANILMAAEMAKAVGDKEFVEECREWFKAGKKSLEDKMWNGKCYLNFYEPETGKKSDLIYAHQLDGEWMANFNGLHDVFNKERRKITLKTIENANVKVTKYGATIYTNFDGSPAEVGGYGKYGMFPVELLMLAMTYMYNGEKEFGMELARRCWNNITNRQGLTWDQPNILRGDKDTGERVFGADYYQNLMLWALPAAYLNQDISGPIKNNGLIERVIKAGRES